MSVKLIEMLVAKGLLNESLLIALNRYMDKWKVSPYTAVIDTRMVDEDTLADCLAELLKIERIYSLDEADVTPDALTKITYRQAHSWLVLPLGSTDSEYFKVLVVDPTNSDIINSVKKIMELPLKLAITEKKSIKKMIDHFYPVELQIPHLLNQPLS